MREAKLKQAGQLTRREIEEKFRALPKITEFEVQAVMTLMDLRADRFAKKLGYRPNEATRDAWYATRIKDVLSGEGESTGVHLDQLPDDQIIRMLADNIEPFRYIKLTPESWEADFGKNQIIKTMIGDTRFRSDQYQKMLERPGRKGFFGLIKPTLERPNFIVREGNTYLFIKAFFWEK